MTELSNNNQNITLVELKPSNKYIVLRQSKRVAQIEDLTLYDFLINKLKGVFLVMGETQVSISDIEYYANILTGDIKKEFPQNTDLEIGEALYNGSRRAYSTEYKFTIAAALNWIRSFNADEKRAEQLMIREPKAKPEPTKEELKQIAEESIRVMIETYKKNGTVLNHGNVNFRYLWNTRQISFGQVQADFYRGQAENKVYSKLKAEREKQASKGLREEVKKIDLEIDSLMTDDMQIRIEAGNLAIIDWINK